MLKVSGLSRIRSLADLMELYERNYIMLRQLLPEELPVASVCMVSRVPHALDLHLQVHERFRFTSELVLSYHFRQGRDWISQPDLHIRIYHDARSAEVMLARPRHAPTFILERDQGSLWRRWKANRLLYKWLHYCLHQGHSFRSGGIGHMPAGFQSIESATSPVL